MRSLRILLILVCALLFLPRDSEALILRQYTTNEQLISNTVYAAIRDSKGYMWFCTDKGLSRFDGNQFRNFTIADGMSDNEVFSLFEDSKGRLWFFTFNGQPCFYHKGKFHNISNDSMLRQFPVIPYMNSMYEKDGILYFGYLPGYLGRLVGDKFHTISSKNIVGGRNHAFTEKDGYLVAIAQEDRTYIANGAVVKRVMRHTPNCFTRSGQLLTLEKTGISIEGPGSEKRFLKDSDLIKTDVLNIYYDQADRVFVSSRMGLLIFNMHTGQKDTLLHNISVSSVGQDQYGNYWITTLEHGVYCLEASLFAAKELFQGDLLKIIRTPGSLFLQHDLSLYSIAPTGQGFTTKLISQLGHISERPLYMDSNRLMYETLHGNELYVYDYKRKKTITAAFNIGHRYLYPLGRDTFLDIDYNSIFKLHIGADRIDVYKGMSGVERMQRHYWSPMHYVYYIIADKLLRYDPDNDSVVHLDKFDFSTTVETIFSIGNWLVLPDNKKQLHLYDERRPSVRRTISCPYVIYSVQEVSTQSYLLQTNEGYVLASADTSAGIALSYRRVEYPFLYLDLHAMYVDGDYLICWIKDQVLYIKKDLLNKELYTPSLFIDNIKINGHGYTSDSIRLTNTTACNITIQLNALSANRDVTYYYRVWQDNNWGGWYNTESPDLNILLYKAGKYKIELKAASKNQRFSPPVVLRIDVIPPFVRSAAFYLIMAGVLLLLLALLIVWLVQLYIHKKRRVFQEELQHLQLEHKAINALLNPHFIFNVVNNIQDLINNNSKESANNYLATMSKMIRQNIENLQFQLIPIANELELIRNYIELQNLRFDNRIRLSLHYDAEATADIYVPPLLLHTFVENALVHGFNKSQPLFHVAIFIDLTINDYLHVRILDDGSGLKDKSASFKAIPGKTSLGIDFNRKRLQRISEFYKVGFSMDLQNRSDGVQGTEVQIILYARFANLIQTSNI